MDESIYFLRSEQHFFDEFGFLSGETIENAKVEYGYVGTPKYDDEGNITNAILFCHNYQGDYSTISDFRHLTGPDGIFDKENYFFISITSLGFPHSCSPSTTGLKRDFPNYTVDDLVNFQRRLIKEKFPNIKKLFGILGYSLGGIIALGWSILYPDDMEFIIHFKSSFKAQGFKYVFANLSNRIIESSLQYEKDIYDESMSQALILVSQIHYLMSFSKEHVCSLSLDEINFSMETFTDQVLFYDIFDIKKCNDFMMSNNLEDGLDKIKCKVLVIGVNNNNYSIPEYDSIPVYEAIENSQYVLLDVKDNPNEMEYIYKIADDIRKFLESI